MTRTAALTPADAVVLDDDDTDMVRVAAGDRAAFVALVARHQLRVRRYLARMVGDAEAVDLCQDTFLRVWNARSAYRARGSFPVFLYRIARNLAFSHLRWRKVRRFVRAHDTDDAHRSVDVVELLDRQPAGLDVSAPMHDDGLARVLRRERRDAVFAHLLEMKPSWREVVVLRHIEDLDYPTIAAVTGISEDNARARAHRGLLWLRARLAEDPA